MTLLSVALALWAVCPSAAAGYRGSAFVVQLTHGAGTYRNSSNTTAACDSWSYSDHAEFTFHDRFPRVFITLGVHSMVNGGVGAPAGSMDGSFSYTDNFHAGCPDESPSSITCPGEVGPEEQPGGPAPLTTGAGFHYRATGSGIDIEVSPSEWGGGDSPNGQCPNSDSWKGNNGLGEPFMLLDGRFLPGFGTAWSYTYFGAHKHIPMWMLHRPSFQVSVGTSRSHENIPAGDAASLNECNVHGYHPGQGCVISYAWHAELSFKRVCGASISFRTQHVDSTDVMERQAHGKCD